MKIFSAELTANPAYYSFGYALYAELEAGDSLDACYAQGFLPFVGAREQKPEMLYMARGTRVRVQEFEARHYHARVARKVAALLPNGVAATTRPKSAYNLDEIETFFLSYFSYRFGSWAMSPERLRAIVRGPFVSHITEYRSGEELLGYTLEVHAQTFIHIWHQAYVKKYEGAHLGAHLYVELIERAKREGKEYLYFGATYGKAMLYKTNFQPLEYWDGRAWVQDPHSRALKELLAGDATRMLAYVDAWRAGKGAYRDSPLPFKSGSTELRYLALFAVLHRRILGLYIILLGVLVGLVVLNLLF